MFVCDLFIQTVLALSEYTQLKNIHFFLGLPHIYISHVICLPTTLHICAHTNTVSECCWTITVAFMFATIIGIPVGIALIIHRYRKGLIYVVFSERI